MNRGARLRSDDAQEEAHGGVTATVAAAAAADKRIEQATTTRGYFYGCTWTEVFCDPLVVLPTAVIGLALIIWGLSFTMKLDELIGLLAIVFLHVPMGLAFLILPLVMAYETHYAPRPVLPPPLTTNDPSATGAPRIIVIVIIGLLFQLVSCCLTNRLGLL